MQTATPAILELEARAAGNGGGGTRGAAAFLMTWLELGPNGRRWRVLVVDDEAEVRALERDVLEAAGFDVVLADSAEAAVEEIACRTPDVVLLDIGLPGRSGLDYLIELRRTSGVPVLLVSATGGEQDRVAGLDLGADDYVVKPFSPAELVARTRAALRARRGGMIAAHIGGDRLDVDLHDRRVSVDGVDVALAGREFELLAVLAASPGRAFTRAELLDQVWGSREGWQDPNTVTEHVSRIRRKLTAATPHDPVDVIETVRGGGYRFRPLRS